MKSKFLKFLIVLLVFPTSIFAQNNKTEKCACSRKGKVKVQEYFDEFENQNKIIADCQSEISQKVKRIRVSGFFPTAVSLVKPYYPKVARQNKIFGTVTVEVIFDEKGYVIYTKAISGNKVFWNSAEKAACISRFTPVQYCGVLVKQRRVIRYNFVL